MPKYNVVVQVSIVHDCFLEDIEAENEEQLIEIINDMKFHGELSFEMCNDYTEENYNIYNLDTDETIYRE